MDGRASVTGGLVLVGGGPSSGKTRFSLALARGAPGRRVYLATAEARDDEMREKIARHVAERADAFETVECALAVEEALRDFARSPNPPDVVVLDCLTLWLSNLLLAESSRDHIGLRVKALADGLASAPFRTVVITNEVGLGLVPETSLGRAFRDVAGTAHGVLAARASEIYVALMGVMLRVHPAPVARMELPS